MSAKSSNYYFNKKYWCESIGYGSCNRVVVTPRNTKYKVGTRLQLLACVPYYIKDSIRPPDQWFNPAYDGPPNYEATVIRVEHNVSPSNTILHLGNFVQLHPTPLWLHTDSLMYAGEIDHTAPPVHPYGGSTTYSTCFAGSGLDVLAIFHSGSCIILFDYVITINGSGFYGDYARIRLAYGPGYGEAGAQHVNYQKGNVFTGSVTPTGTYKVDTAVFVLISFFGNNQPDYSTCRFQLSNIRMINKYGDEFGVGDHFSLDENFWYHIVMLE